MVPCPDVASSGRSAAAGRPRYRQRWRARLRLCLATLVVALAGASAHAQDRRPAAPTQPPVKAAATAATTPRLRAPPAPAEKAVAAAAPERRALISAVRSWGYQLIGLSVDEAANSPYDLIIVDATAGLASEKPFTREDVERLKKKPDGSRRIVLSYLSIGESEDYRGEYFSKEYLEEEAPDWLLKENKQWKGNRLIRFCEEGWQLTILGDEKGISVYSAEPSPLYKLIELGFDGVSLDRVDVYGEVAKECPDARARMVTFVRRLAAHARKANPRFIVILQNAEELIEDKSMIEAIDAVLKEDLYFGAPTDGRPNNDTLIRETLARLRKAQNAGRAVLVIEYIKDRVRAGEIHRRAAAEGFAAYVAPRKLDRLWLPGVNF